MGYFTTFWEKIIEKFNILRFSGKNEAPFGDLQFSGKNNAKTNI